jgi:D-arabinose 1-dehydrogenase-like Zn-dependent alcohol dehydrogenase
MKAIFITEPGGPEKLVFGDRPDPEAGPGEVVVRVRASAVNHADLSIRAGRSATGGLPRILGLDMAGEVARLGPGVTGWREGDRVVVENRVKCGTCTPCVLGRDEYCERQKRLGGELDGHDARPTTLGAAAPRARGARGRNALEGRQGHLAPSSSDSPQRTGPSSRPIR